MKNFLFILFLLSCGSLAAQTEMSTAAEPASLVKWMTLKEAETHFKEVPKPIIIDFYTEWCGWCKVMMKNTYSNPNIASYINANFYPVKFDAETKDTVEFEGIKYAPTGKEKRDPNEFAVKMLNGKLVYPSTLFLNKAANFNMSAQGYLEPQKIEPMLVFVLENAFRNSSYDDFKDMFEKAFYDSSQHVLSEKTKWKTAAESFAENQKPSGKKRIVFIHTEWCNSCRVMYRTTFSDTSLSGYLEKTFDLINFNPETKNQLYFGGKSYEYMPTREMPFHQLVYALDRNSFALPQLVFLDEHDTIIDVVPFYLAPKIFNDIIHFYGDDRYKNTKWEDFQKERNK